MLAAATQATIHLAFTVIFLLVRFLTFMLTLLESGFKTV